MMNFGDELQDETGLVPGGAMMKGARENRPLQLVETGNADDDYSFTLCDDNLDRVLAKVPEGMEVSVVSVVGAFRTGKSFLLSFFLRFLNSGSIDDPSDDWMTADGPSLREGNRNINVNADKEVDGEREGRVGSALAEVGGGLRSFEWRGGSERMTTGIWMWSEPFVRRTEAGKDVAVLLVDTQGMFDNETSMGLTACIFAVSTLLSSCQIYNVEKRIQEDHLQQLALFSEYGRMALSKEQEISSGVYDGDTSNQNPFAADAEASTENDDAGQLNSMALKSGEAPAVGYAAMARAGAEARARRPVGEAGVAAEVASTIRGGGGAVGEDVVDGGVDMPQEESKNWVERPFQRLEFLVRDWQAAACGFQNYPGEIFTEVVVVDDLTPETALDPSHHGRRQNYEDEELPTDKLQDEMDDYLVGVINDKGVKDLRDTREQITSCFEKISCFGLTHPGFDVVKKTYKGEISKVQPSFLRLLNAYVRHIFGELLEPKRINGRFLTGPELRNYAAAYVQLFHNGAHFPAAKSLLEATAGAHNGNAKHVAISGYKAEMDRLVGPKATSYTSKEAFEEHERLCRQGSFTIFDTMATMGRRSEVMRVRALLLDELNDSSIRYGEANEARNPYRGTEYWVIPMMIAFASYLAKWIADISCSPWSHSCRKTSDALGFIYFAMVIVLLVMFRQKVKGVAEHFGHLVPVLFGNLKDQITEAQRSAAKNVKKTA